MGLGTQVFILMLCISFVLYGLGYPSAFVQFVTGDLSTLNSQMTTLLTVAGGAAIVAAILNFPNMFGLFAGIGMFLVTFLTFPISVFSEPALPTEIRIFISSIYGVMYLLAILTWFKGGGEF